MCFGVMLFIIRLRKSVLTGGKCENCVSDWRSVFSFLSYNINVIVSINYYYHFKKEKEKRIDISWIWWGDPDVASITGFEVAFYSW
jgi:hypothetical protein